MSGMIRAEIARMMSRRFFRALLVLCVAGILAAGIANFFTSSTDVASARARAEAEIRRCQEDFRRFAAEGDLDGFKPEITDACGTVEERLGIYDRRYRYAEEVLATTRGVAAFGIVLAFLVAASAMGAEWGTGGITTLLTWEPRRGRVLAAKATAAFLTVGAAVVLLLAFLAVVHLPAGGFRGTMSGFGGGFLRSLTGLWGKGAALAGIAALFGVAGATLTRNTAGAVGTGAVLMSVVDPLASAWRGRRLSPWLFSQNFAQFLGFPVPDRTPQTGALEGPVPLLALRVLPPWRPALLLSLYVTAALLVAYAAFRARDVA